MKRALIASIFALGLAITGVASAADLEGTVKTIQINERVMTLSDGTTLHWTESITVSQDVQEGASVKATYEPQGDKYVLTRIEVVK
jgi:hypothetical protein